MGDFIYSIFDWNMRQMITPRIISFVFISAVIIYFVAGIGAYVLLFAFGWGTSYFMDEPALAGLAVIAIPLVSLIFIITTRLTLEAIAIRFKQYEILEMIYHEMVDGGGN